MTKFQNKYRIASHRKPNWDYSTNGMYFLTIVTQHRECNLGEIQQTTMILSDFGKIVETEWYKSFDIRDELFLDECIIMPNHIHAIVVLNNQTNGGDGDFSTPIQTTVFNSNDELSTIKRNPAIRLPKSISSFMAGFKSAVNTKIDNYLDLNQLHIPKFNRNNHFFQPNYHDHIIRNEWEYLRIKNYIINNPQNWKKDHFHKQQL